VFPTDYLVLIFSYLMILISFLFFNTLHQPALFLIADITILITLFCLIFHKKRITDSASYRLHSLLPLISLVVYYLQATACDHLIFRESFDPFLIAGEHCLFGNLNLPASFSGNHLLVDELMHFFYFSYYLILFIPGIIMLSKRSPKAHEMIFSLTLMMYTHFIFFILFPGDGPVANRAEIFPKGLIFVLLMNIIYEIGGNQGGGAFPSTHVAAPVMIFLYSFSGFGQNRRPIQLAMPGIILATVYCSYHYIVDILAGLITGIVFYFIGKIVYLSRSHPAELSGESLSR